MAPGPDLHEIDKTLTAHLASCELQNKQIWHELRSLKHVVWAAAIAGYSVLGGAVALFLKFHLKL